MSKLSLSIDTDKIKKCPLYSHIDRPDGQVHLCIINGCKCKGDAGNRPETCPLIEEHPEIDEEDLKRSGFLKNLQQGKWDE